jgi:hypothetical protein
MSLMNARVIAAIGFSGAAGLVSVMAALLLLRDMFAPRMSARVLCATVVGLAMVALVGLIVHARV